MQRSSSRRALAQPSWVMPCMAERCSSNFGRHAMRRIAVPDSALQIDGAARPIWYRDIALPVTIFSRVPDRAQIRLVHVFRIGSMVLAALFLLRQQAMVKGGMTDRQRPGFMAGAAA